MERGWKMDLARSASNRSSLIPTMILTFLLFGNAVPVRAADDQLTHRAKQLFADRRWQEIAGLGKSAKNPSADFDFYYGTALAQLGRLADAQNAFAAGAKLQPQDKRFPLEQAGVSFKAKSYSQSARHLRRALRIDPHDSYGNNFLGTVYFLQGNIDAALKYWNRVDKPRIAERSECACTAGETSVARSRLCICSGKRVASLRSADYRHSGPQLGDFSEAISLI